MIRTDWSDVRDLLARLAAEPSAEKIFGASGHQWLLEPPLTAAELAEVEAQVRVELPSEYRSFLLEAGRGGAGPAYGLFPLRRVEGRWRWEGDGATLTGLDTLAQPFPHVEAFNPAEGLPEPPDEDDYDSEEAFFEAAEAYFEQHDAVVFRPEHSVGLLYLCHLGCALREALVVSGPARGQMWADNTADDAGFAPLLGDAGRPLGFAQWYRRWLDRAAAQLPAGLDA
ncbi:SMI1/KNR4 family protein [Frankia sp. CN6]|uniref:SMI1/KNR4 family protein n=1 Tax=Frankia nepalensis TaxID=1836974 RepID=A0A937RL27_9ACTN|nr:SMI1/KNR4 family protein [Frankia nepalensis]MBL7628388.1 SMI1/KNR4 family protein [Frankia nepalensis]